MRKHSAAIKQIRTTLKTLAAEKPRLRAEVQALKYGPDGLRRPETGQQRYWLKQEYNWSVRPEVRATMLAYGLLRGVPYRTMEPKSCAGELQYMIGRVLKAIHRAIGDDEALKAEWSIDRVESLINDGVDTLAPSEAA